MKKFTLVLLLLIHIALANDKSYEEGKILYFSNGCGNCHGTEAEGSSYYPRLSNKTESFLVDKLQKFKNGIATTQKQEIMFTFAKPLNDNEIIALSHYLSTYHKEYTNKYDVQEDLLGVDF